VHIRRNIVSLRRCKGVAAAELVKERKKEKKRKSTDRSKEAAAV
jgi:hypothetical protein